ncbi:hypothetical protein IF2G_05609 [Cordyceps javanica]|nr:hypothetical protein IF2G_05609 [Cordyceps javanica]
MHISIQATVAKQFSESLFQSRTKELACYLLLSARRPVVGQNRTTERFNTRRPCGYSVTKHVADTAA